MEVLQLFSRVTANIRHHKDGANRPNDIQAKFWECWGIWGWDIIAFYTNAKKSESFIGFLLFSLMEKLSEKYLKAWFGNNKPLQTYQHLSQ